MKKSIIMFAICCIIGVSLGIYFFSKNPKEEIDTKIAIEDECTITAGTKNNKVVNSIVVNSTKDKIGTTTKIIKKTYYKDCNHIIEETNKPTEELINLTEEELKDLYKDWEIERFTTKEVILYKEIDDFCNEHFILKDENGYITIYKTDMTGKETLHCTTDIWTGYLSESDLESIKNGLKVYTTRELNKLIEDFE